MNSQFDKIVTVLEIKFKLKQNGWFKCEFWKLSPGKCEFCVIFAYKVERNKLDGRCKGNELDNTWLYLEGNDWKNGWKGEGKIF